MARLPRRMYKINLTLFSGLTDLQLIPYGCTRLRITEFPTLPAPPSTRPATRP